MVSRKSKPGRPSDREDGVEDRLEPRFLLAFRLRFLGSGRSPLGGRTGWFSTALLGRPNGPWTGRVSFTTAASTGCDADAVTRMTRPHAERVSGHEMGVMSVNPTRRAPRSAASDLEG